MKKILFISAIILLASACKKDSSEIDQNTIYQSYSMVYDEETDQTTVSAKFFEDKMNGKNLELTGGSKVTMNGSTMTKNGTTYSSTVDGYLATASLIFTNSEGKEYANTINKANPITNDDEMYLNKNITGYWYWFGNTIASGEKVSLSLINVPDNSLSQSFSETTIGRDYVKMLASSLINLPDGNTKVTISRSKETTTGNFATVGGTITATYKGLNNYVEIY
ncbi:MAG: hypothetical protein ACK5B9_12325 [Flavobacteriia bacterium]|jgi:hypothetical protein